MFTNNVGGRNSNQGGRGLSPIVERSIVQYRIDVIEEVPS